MLCLTSSTYFSQVYSASALCNVFILARLMPYLQRVACNDKSSGRHTGCSCRLSWSETLGVSDQNYLNRARVAEFFSPQVSANANTPLCWLCVWADNCRGAKMWFMKRPVGDEGQVSVSWSPKTDCVKGWNWAFDSGCAPLSPFSWPVITPGRHWNGWNGCTNRSSSTCRYVPVAEADNETYCKDFVWLWSRDISYFIICTCASSKA